MDVPGHGKMAVDIAYGGAFYAFASAERLGLDICSAKTRDLVEAASAVTEAVKAQVSTNTAFITRCPPLWHGGNVNYTSMLLNTYIFKLLIGLKIRHWLGSWAL